MRRTGAWLLCLAGAGAMRAEAQAQIGFEDLEVQVRARSRWPQRADAGWIPIRVEAENEGDQERRVQLTLRAEEWDGCTLELNRSFVLEAGKSERAELAFPAWINQEMEVSMVVDVERSSQWSSGAGQVGHPIHTIVCGIFLVRDEWTPAVGLAWEEALTTAQLTLSGTTAGNVSLGVVPWDEAPRRVEPYSSLDVVLLATDAGPPPAEVAAALATWTRLGGRVVAVGPNAQDCLWRSGFAEWMEPRFVLARWNGDVPAWRVGMGSVVAVEAEAVVLDSADSLRQTLQDVLRNSATGQALASLRDGVRVERVRDSWPTIPGIQRVPYRWLALCLVLFALAVGPVNFLLARKLKRPGLVFLTIPGGALVATLVILAVGVLYQGLGIRECVLSHTLLDQRAHRADTLSACTLFAGLSPRHGLRPDASTIVLPLDTRTGAFRVQTDGGLELHGEFVPTRRLTRLGVAAERAARGRLEIRRDANALVVDNALDAAVRALVVRAPDGSLFWLDGGLDVGATGRLSALSEEAAEASLEATLGTTTEAYRLRPVSGSIESLPMFEEGRTLRFQEGFGPLAGVRELWPAGYIAVLADNPFRDRLGLEAKSEPGGLDLVYGVLDADESAW